MHDWITSASGWFGSSERDFSEVRAGSEFEFSVATAYPACPMAHVLAVGIATLDIINQVESYPPEDTEVRAFAQTVRRGGNATNTLVALNQLGHHCEWAGICVNEPDAAIIFSDLERNNVGTRYCRILSQGKMPTSYITTSRYSASRTIVHYRDLPEFDHRHFSRIPLREFDWIHFEGRNIKETLMMMQRVRCHQPGPTVSLEVEKPRSGVQSLLTYADLILFSPLVAAHYGYSAEGLLEEMHRLARDTDIVCTLGDKGAIAMGRKGEFEQSDACPPGQLVDTVGAGDVFNAGMIDALLRDCSLSDALKFACQLAGNKCGQAGLESLVIPERMADQ